MLALVANFNPFAAWTDEVLKRGVEVQIFSVLVVIGDGEVGALANLAAVGLELAQDQFEQGGFSCAIGADEAHFVASQNGGAEVLHDVDVCAIGSGRLKGEADLVELGHQFATRRAFVDFELDLAHDLFARLSLSSQLFKPHNATLTACSASFHPFAHPNLFGRQEFVGLGLDHRFLRHLGLFEDQILGKVTGVGEQSTAVEFDDASRDPIEKGAVMGDADHAAFEGDQKIFKPNNAVDVQVVGGLVQEEHIGRGDQGLGQRHALGLTTR